MTVTGIRAMAIISSTITDAATQCVTITAAIGANSAIAGIANIAGATGTTIAMIIGVADAATLTALPQAR